MQRTSATARIPVFNGEDGQFPFFKTRFLAAVCGLGGHYHPAMEGLAPYNTCEYTSSQITLSPFKTPQKGRTEVKVQAEEVDHTENYHQISRHIFSILILSIGEEPLKHLVNAGMVQGDGIGAWKLLCKEYESATSVNQRRLFNELINMKMEGKLAKLADYLYAFKRITSTLKGMSIELPEQLLISILLAGLSTEYEQIINILNSMTTLSLDTCLTQLKTFQATNEIDVKSSSGQLQGYATSNDATKRSSNRRGMMSCFNCNRTHMGGEFECKEPCRVCKATDHVRYHCPERKRRREEKQGRDSGPQPQARERGNAANADLVQQLSRLLGAALSTQQDAGNGGSVDWGIDDNRPLNGQERS